MKLVNMCFVGRMKDFISPSMVYKGVGGTGEKCYVQAAVPVCSVPSLCAAPVCFMVPVQSWLSSHSSPILAALAATQLCVMSSVSILLMETAAREGPAGLAVQCPASGIMVLHLSLVLAIVEFPRVKRHWLYE